MAADAFVNALDFEDFENLPELLNRLRDLPEFGMQCQLEEVLKLIDGAQEAQRLAAQQRKVARIYAQKLFAKVRKQWTKSEIDEATGYGEK